MEGVIVDDGVFGNITIADDLVSLLVTGGPIGSLGTPVTISIADNLVELQATEIHAAITADDINKLVATTGDVTGSIAAIQVIASNLVAGDGITIADDLDADLTLSGAILAPIAIGGDLTGDITADRLYFTPPTGFKGTITIGDMLIGDLIISDNNGLDEQVIINANNNVYTNWTDAWTGDVIVHGVTVTPGDYPNTDLGDGAIGLARFTLHKEACLPVHGDDRAGLPANGRVELMHYGPFTLAPNAYTMTHLGIQRRPYAGGTWTNVTTQFELDSGLTAGRRLVIMPKNGYAWQYDSEYKFNHDVPEGMSIPVFGYLKCLGVDTSPALLQDDAADGAYLYSFKIQPQ